MSDIRTNAFGQPIGPAVPDWQPRPAPPRTTIEGRYVRIEPLEVRHTPDLHAAYTESPDDRDWTYLFDERPASLEECVAYVTRLSQATDLLHHALLDRATGRAVGTAALMRIERTHGVIEIGHIAYAPALQKTRVATETVYLFMRRVFEELGYRRFEWKCDSLNAPSRAAAIRYGFQFEGLFRQAVVYKGRSRDTAWFSVVDTEWPRLKKAFEAWLDPANFTEAGRQRESLVTVRERLG
jgi:RimJ/RimL family protein N-acetyltransferase